MMRQRKYGEAGPTNDCINFRQTKHCFECLVAAANQPKR